jgi:glycosyltransferase involved in cell wall biosynthesis
VQSPLRALQRVLNLAKFCGEVFQCAIFLREHRVSLLHLNNSVTRTHDWMLAAWLTRTPWIVHERGINDRFSFTATQLARRASAIICISEAVRANLTAHRIGKGSLRVIENGLDPTRVEPLSPPEEVRRSLGIEIPRRVIGIVGNIKHWKGQEVVVRALPAIVAKVPEVVCLFVGSEAAFGPDRDYEAKLRDLVRQLGLERHVIFTGYREDVASVLNLMEVVIHASILPEPFGRVLLEAMAMRKPTVGSRAGGVPEIIDHGVTGYTFTPGDADALASYVADLLEHPTVARAFGEAGHARLLERFSINANVSRTVSLYDEVLSKGRLHVD